MTDFYSILGVERSASQAEIKTAYVRLSKALHPDVNPNGAALMRQVNEAYEVLGEAKKRAAFDRGEKVREFPKSNPPQPADNWANEGGTINMMALASKATPDFMRGDLLPLVGQLLSQVVGDPKAVTVKEISGLVANAIRPKRGRKSA